jgi:ABC-type Mn2+/Zn2+ transport system permease subunit
MELFDYVFMQRAMLEAVLIGGVCAVVGVYVVLNGLSFIGAGIAHSTFAGVAIGFLLGVNPVLTALLFSVLVAFGIGAVQEREAVKHDTAVGIFFASSMALGALLIGFLDGMYVDVFSYLFGNILALDSTDIWISAAMAFVVIAVVVLFYKELLAMSFDAEVAKVMGLPVRTLSYLLLVLISVTVVLSVKAVGVVLVSALIVTPAAAAYQFTRRFHLMMLLSLFFGVTSSVGGLLFSFYINVPSGASIVLTATAVFFVSWLLSPKRRGKPA